MLVSSVASQVLLCTTSCSRARSPVADDMKATRGMPCPSASQTGVSACNYILTEVYSGIGQQRQMKACQTLSRALLTFLWYSHRHVRGCAARPGMPSFDAGWDLLRSSTSVGLFSSLTPSPHPLWLPWVYLPTVVCPHSLRATDARERFRWQIAFSRWFFKPQWHFTDGIQQFILYSCMSDTCSTGHSCRFFFFLNSYTNRWDGFFSN